MHLGALKKGPIDQYLNEARGSSHKKALLCAAYATTRSDENVAAEYMQVSFLDCTINDFNYERIRFVESL